MPLDRVLLYLPMMRAEDTATQARAVETFRRLLDDARDADGRAQLRSSFEYAERHRAVVDRSAAFRTGTRSWGATRRGKSSRF